MKLRSAFLTVFFLALVGCVSTPPPLLEFTLADTALKAAKNVQAVRYAPQLWYEAEEAFRQGRILYNEREYEQARELFIKARSAAEKSEMNARITRFRNGEIL